METRQAEKDTAKAKPAPKTLRELTANRAYRKKHTSASQYLNVITSTHYRRQIRQHYREQGGFDDRKFNDTKRRLLWDCIDMAIRLLEERYARSRKAYPPVLAEMQAAVCFIEDDINFPD